MLEGPGRTGLLVAFLGLAGCDMYPVKARVPCSMQVDSEGIQRLVVDTSNGRIKIDCVADQATFEVEAVKFARGTTEDDAREHAELIRIETRRPVDQPGLLTIEVVIPRELKRRSAGADFLIRAPRALDLALQSSNGSIVVAGALGNVQSKTSNGAITLRSIQGDVLVRTSNGAVELEEIEGNVEARTSNGKITLTGVHAHDIRATTSNGTIRGRDMAGDTRLKTSNGKIDIQLATVKPAQQISVVTSNGSVSVRVPDTVNARLELHTSNGRIRTDLKNVVIREHRSGKHRFEAVLNAGGGNIELETNNGSIHFATDSTDRSRRESGG